MLQAASDETGDFDFYRRHTWESWRNHYNKNRKRLDYEIDEYVKTIPMHLRNKGRDHRSSHLNKLYKFQADEEETEEGKSEDDRQSPVTQREVSPQEEEETEGAEDDGETNAAKLDVTASKQISSSPSISRNLPRSEIHVE